ncbi:MAG: glycosyl hydrolase [Flavipsychrobacter sp.]|nr:glycosyl hydrolase [Flavipsychrobacter sp.]
MKKYYGIIIALFLWQSTMQAQVSWPAVTQIMKPWTRWWWQGSAVDSSGLTWSMEQYKNAGLGGMEVTPIYGVKGAEQKFVNFLSPQWVALFQYTLKEAERLDLGIDMATVTGWPFGGPWVTPEDASKDVHMKMYKLDEGEVLKETIQFVQTPLVRTESGKKIDISALSYPIATNKNLQAYAFDQVQYEKMLPLITLMAYSSNGQVVDLTNHVDAAGKLDWQASAGKWTLYALFMGWHGKMVERAAPGGEGYAIDHFSATALKNYLHAFDTAFANKDIHHLRAFFNDSYEVDDAVGQSTWSPGLLNEFKERRGYDLKQQLPALFQNDVPDKNMRVLYDYRETISELLLEKFTQPWHEWAKAKGKIVRNQSHGSPANILDLYATIDIPETEGDDILRYKFATSAAHVMGKPLASSESATWLNEHFLSSLGDVKAAVDKLFVGGVNHIFYHGTNYSPANEVWPGWLFYAATHFTPANPMWKDFGTLNHYVARTQSFLQTGNSDNDVLVYFPFSDKISEPGNEMLIHFDGMKGFQNTVFDSVSEMMLARGYSFDMISDKQLKNVAVDGSQLSTGGVHYQTILLAGVKYLPLETLKQLLKLAKAGATIICLNNLPGDVPGYENLAARQNEFKTLLQQLKFTTVDDVQTANVSSGRFLLGDDAALLLATAKVRRESVTDLGLRFVRRSWNNGNIYFISNPLVHPFSGYIKLAATFNSAALYDPMHGECGVARMHNSAKEGTWVFISLQPGESCILQTAHSNITGASFPYTDNLGTPQKIAGNWKLKFISGGPSLPAPVMIDRPGSWTDLGNDSMKYFSGTAEYSINFKKPVSNARSWILDMGKVGESAEVILNGKSLGTLIGPSYRLVINANDLKTTNQLKILVTNSMANRIIWLDKNKVQWKKFYNINMPAHLKENRGADGLLNTSGWVPKPSGLLSPVTLIPVTDK